MKGLVDKDGRPPSVAYKLFCGGFAGAMAQTLTYPLDLIRRRFQVMNLKAEAGGFAYHYSSTGDAFRQVQISHNFYNYSFEKTALPRRLFNTKG